MSDAASPPGYEPPAARVRVECDGPPGMDCGEEYVGLVPPGFSGPNDRKWYRCPFCEHPNAVGARDKIQLNRGEDS